MVVDGLHLAQQPADLVATVTGEVRTDPGLQVGRLAHVEHLARPVGEPVDPGPMGEVEQLLEAEDPERPGSLEHGVEEVAGGQHVVERPVRRLMGEAEGRRQGAELAVGNHVPDQAAGEGQGVHGGIGQSFPPRRLQGMVEEGQVEPEVVTDQHGAAHELEERREHLADPGGTGDHGVGDPGQGGDERRDSLVGPDEGLIGPEQLATPVPGRRHLGEGRGRRSSPRRPPRRSPG